MKVVYTAPNRAHHYRYATYLHESNCLHAFVSGFPRLSPRAKLPEVKDKLYHADFMQTLYLASLKAKLPISISDRLAFISKIEQDNACQKFVKNCDIFLFYNGSGLNNIRRNKNSNVTNVVEVVNSHVAYQEELLEEEHDNLGIQWRPFPKYEKERRMQEYEEADYILLPSEFVRKSFLDKGYSEQKLLKVAYGFDKIDSHKTRLNNSLKSEHFTVLYVGSISVRKGIKYLVEAFAGLQHKSKRLLLVGPDMQDGALNGITLTSDIIFTGSLKGEQLAQAYHSADVFCLPSIEEGFGLVLGEALSFGIPLITTTNSAASDLITDGHEGYIVPIKSSQAILQKLQFLADNPLVLYQLGVNSRAKAAGLGGWEQTGANLINTLRNVFFHAHSH